MTAYIVVPYGIFPYFLLYECEDTGKKYKVCQGLTFSYSKVIKRLSEEEFQIMKDRKGKLESKKRGYEKVIQAEAKELLNLF